jgi:membrane protein implicated in regulation of membrane protease activity
MNKKGVLPLLLLVPLIIIGVLFLIFFFIPAIVSMLQIVFWIIMAIVVLWFLLMVLKYLNKEVKSLDDVKEKVKECVGEACKK